MQIETKRYRGKTHNNAKLVGTDSHVGKLIFTASTEIDAVELAALANAWAKMTDSPELREHRKKALNAFCDKHKISIKLAQ